MPPLSITEHLKSEHSRLFGAGFWDTNPNLTFLEQLHDNDHSFNPESIAYYSPHTHEET